MILSYAKNFLPILFNLYVAVPAGAEEAGQRLAAFETAKLFYQISDPNMVNNMFDKALQMHKSDVVFTRDAVMDLLRSMIPHIDISRIEILYKETMSRVESKDQKEQKKREKFKKDRTLLKCKKNLKIATLNVRTLEVKNTELEDINQNFKLGEDDE